MEILSLETTEEEYVAGSFQQGQGVDRRAPREHSAHRAWRLHRREGVTTRPSRAKVYRDFDLSIRHHLQRTEGRMASQQVADVEVRRPAPRSNRDSRSWINETKPSFLTTEFYAMIAGIMGVLIAAQQADNLDAPLAWTLAAAIAIGYILSRGLAKSGSAYRDHND